MSLIVAVMPAPSLSLIYPLCSSNNNALASLVVSFGTAIDTPLDEDEHPVRAVAAMSAASAPTASFFELRLKTV